MTFKALQTYRTEDNTYQTKLIERSIDELPDGELLIAVQYSSLNYKDALSANGNPGVTRHYPHTPGIDAVGVVKESANPAFSAGDVVIVTGYDLGMNTDGGLAECIRVPAAWAIALPSGLSARQAMILGTAGLTAGLCVHKLLQMGAAPEQGPVLVTGASGGVGSVAVELLSVLGFNVTASTGSSTQADMLRSLGATEIIERQLLSEKQAKPLFTPQWAHAVDCVGGNTLANVLKSINPSGSVACCGLVESADLRATVLPFILRDINLLGVDSVEISRDKKREIWHKFATSWQVKVIENLTQEVSLQEAIKYLPRFFGGGVKGRVLVNISA